MRERERVCKRNRGRTCSLKLPLSMLSPKLPILHPSCFPLARTPSCVFSPSFLTRFLSLSARPLPPDCHSINSSVPLYVSASLCSLFPSYSSQSLSLLVCLVGKEGLHTVAQEKTETVEEIGGERGLCGGDEDKTQGRAVREEEGKEEERIKKKEETEMNYDNSQTIGEAVREQGRG